MSSKSSPPYTSLMMHTPSPTLSLDSQGDNDMTSYAHASHEIKVEGQDNLQEYGPPGMPFSLNTIINPTGGLSDPSTLSSAPEPTPEELEHYLYLFFSAFGTQIPLVHPSTWKPEGKPPVLIRAMQACGALFVKTKTGIRTCFCGSLSWNLRSQMWVNSPDATRYDNNREEAPFVYNTLPFFWLAQVSLMVLQEDSGVGTKLIEPQNETGFRL
ncbi:hypothetical protein AGABI2DRAFT_181393 [Agaricus bisporus var. bisporus H97]|uniref:hypothetical protein n=1 Tax=Agaricus bisporus var. bisporus (strain H97 / ATCC MYA-4626 / FGSC 10389) TaxID=936046 RepID=UPI00029F7B22|nr:hypothetical protein AGABI2DRAFT_181393 [Agaricus bisporus var. bisporus H97]EKV42141.1 hypothetical protein AGABI2DRAFT_181393 [Agaricus bisporus var. bisporus H97]